MRDFSAPLFAPFIATFLHQPTHRLSVNHVGTLDPRQRIEKG